MIIHAETGAQEVKLLVNFLISHGYMHFYVVKYILTAAVVFILCISRCR